MSEQAKKQTRGSAGRSAKAPVRKDAEGGQNQTGTPVPAPLAPAPDVNGQVSQPAGTTQVIAADPVPAAGLSPATNGVADNASGDGANLQSGEATLVTQLRQDHERAFSTAADVTVLEVRAIPEGGFYRAGRFWPHDVVHVFVSDNPDEQVIEDVRGQPLYGCVISTADAKRLKAEKMLGVTELATVTAPGAEDA